IAIDVATNLLLFAKIIIMFNSLDNKKNISNLDKFEWVLFYKAKDIGTKIAEKNSTYKTDIRYTTYITLSSIIRSIKLFFIFKEEYMDKEEWQDLSYGKYFYGFNRFLPINESDRNAVIRDFYKNITLDFYNFIVVGAYSSLFSIMESRFRLLYNYFFSGLQKGEINDNPKLKSITTELLKKLNLTEKSITIELFSNV